MPQMAPMNWMMLFFYFYSILIMISILNYYMFLYKPISKSSKTNYNHLNWKW